MQGRASGTPAVPQYSQRFLPDFCANRAVFLVVLIAELLAFVLVLSDAQEFREFWLDLALLSLFIQWTALGSAAVLCFSGRWLTRLNRLWATLVTYGLTQLVTLLCSALAVWIIASHGVGFALINGLETIPFVVRSLAISSIVSLVALRYFYVQQQWKRNVEAEAQARLLALQTRIRPHFLFNSLNTIVSLIRAHPDQAEQAIVDLAGLFRSTLEQKEKISLEDELEITRRYLRMEALRLGERLQVDWQLEDDLPLKMPIPALILQPLVENAIYHGIQPRIDGGRVTIQINTRGKAVQFIVSNPLPTTGPTERQEGNHVAQDNIRQRLALAYGKEVAMEIKASDGNYSVSFAIPQESRR
jgi:two-component system sensor histidine kinase AlgZ